MEYVESSNAAETYLKHFSAMKWTEGQPEHKSFALQKDGYSLVTLKEIAESLSVGKKVFVVVEWPEVFEVMRLPDGASSKLFYKNLAMQKSEKLQNADETLYKLQCTLKNYLELPLESCLNYDSALTAEIKSNNLVTYGYIQRRLAAVACFRKSQIGSTGELKKCFAKLVEIGYLVEMKKADLCKFGITALTYKIMKLDDV